MTVNNAARPAVFKWRQTAPELILCEVRWYLRYSRCGGGALRFWNAKPGRFVGPLDRIFFLAKGRANWRASTLLIETVRQIDEPENE